MPCCRLHLEALEPRHLPSAISDLAYPFANERVAEPLQNFFVYKDADSAFNHGFPSGFFGAASKLHIGH
jgi:hypothetical protein